MGANTFFVRAKGSNARDAFNGARDDARWEHGHGGYTGTIAEKHEFTVIEVPAGEDARKYAAKLIADDDERIDDKWGPAGCIKLGGDEWLFFGWASS
jgi:hypothetical protein